MDLRPAPLQLLALLGTCLDTPTVGAPFSRNGGIAPLENDIREHSVQGSYSKSSFPLMLMPKCVTSEESLPPALQPCPFSLESRGQSPALNLGSTQNLV